jgi:glucose/arabinose dehydrogenase
LPEGFQETIVLGGLDQPVAVEFSSDGRVFVAEKSGLVKVFDDLSDATPAIFADLRTQVHNYWDQGLLALALDRDFPTRPYIYVLYTLDAAVGGTPPRWNDDCPTPPGPLADGCVVGGRLSRLEASGSVMVGVEQILIEDWCQQYPSHSVGALAFGPDGALYVSAGEGASFGFVDWGQEGNPVNPCGDPGGSNPTPPTAEGGALRSQDLRTMGDPVTFDGAILRLNPDSGAGLPDNPLFGGAEGDDRVIAYGLRNPFRFAVRPGTDEIWIGDVGSRYWEEINLVGDTNDLVVENFGWPCYEGVDPQPGFAAADLEICENLYATPSAVTPPVFRYSRNEKVVPGESCPMGNAALAGLAFYPGGNYPPEYEGALFFADYVRDCIWVMFKDVNGNLDPTTRTTFLSGAANPVNLTRGPGGDLFYVDFDAGTIRRIQYFSENQPPLAGLQASPTSGPAPLQVDFDGSGSSDPNPGDSITYAWDLDGDGDHDDATGVNPLYTYTELGIYTVSLRVTDNHGATGTASILIQVANTPPTATILTPSPSTTWSVGEVIAFSGSASDFQDGTLPASALSWTLVLHHCATPTLCHPHPLVDYPGVSGGSFSAPGHEYPSTLELRLVATDSGGLRDEEAILLYPNSVELTFESNPAGLELVVGEVRQAAPFTRTAIVGSTISIGAPSPQSAGETVYEFVSWSDGGPQAHNLTAGTTPAAYTATFVALFPDLVLSPTGWDFGPVRLWSSSPPLPFTLANQGNAPLQITAATLEGRQSSQFRLDCLSWPLTLAAGEEIQCRATFRPTATGKQVATLVVHSNDPDQPRISAPLLGFGQRWTGVPQARPVRSPASRAERATVDRR